MNILALIIILVSLVVLFFCYCMSRDNRWKDEDSKWQERMNYQIHARMNYQEWEKWRRKW